MGIEITATQEMLDIINSNYPTAVSDSTMTKLQFESFLERNGYEVLSDGTVVRDVINSNGTCAKAVVEVSEGVENTNSYAPVTATTTAGGTSLLGGALIAEVSPAMIGSGVLAGMGIGWELYKSNPEFWTEYSDSLFDALSGKTIKPADTIGVGNSTMVVLRAQTGANANTYAKLDDVLTAVQIASDKGALNGATGRFDPLYTVSGDYQLSGGGASPEMCLAFVNSTEDVVDAFTYRWNIACNGETPDAVTIMHCYDSFNDLDVIDCYPYKLDNAVLHLTVAGDNYTVSTLAQRNLGRASIRVRRSDGDMYGHGSDVGHLPESNIIHGTTAGEYGIYNVYSTVFANYKPAVRGLVYNPECETITDPAQFETTYADWIAKGFELGTFDPETSTIKNTKYVPIGLFDLNENAPSHNPTPENQQNAQTGKVPENPTEPWKLSKALQKLFTPNINFNVAPPSPEFNDGNTPAVVTPSNSMGNKLYTVYNPTNANLNSLGGYLWDDSILEKISKMFSNNPLDAVISLHQLYATPATSGSAPIMLGTCNSGVSATLVSNQYVTINCGSINIPEVYNDARDYMNVDCQLYLPFISFRSLDAHDVIGCTLNVTYNIDVYTGSCVAIVTVTKGTTTQCLYTFEGNCAVTIPLTASDHSRTLGTIASSCASFITGTVLTGGNIGAGIATAGVNTGASVLNGGMQNTIQRTSGFSGNCGAMTCKTPYMIVTRLHSADAVNYASVLGNPTNKGCYLKDCSGYTRVKEIHLDNLKCTDYEKSIIESMLKNGIEI